MELRPAAAVWRVGDRPPCRGKLELDHDALVLSGANAEEGVRVAFTDVVSVSIGRSPEERINGAASLVIHRRNGERLLTYVFGSIGALAELRELISTLVQAGLG